MDRAEGNNYFSEEDDEDELSSIDVADGLLGIRNKKKFKICSSLSQDPEPPLALLALCATRINLPTKSICCSKFKMSTPCLHYLAKTGDIRNLKEVLQANKISYEQLIFADQIGRTALHYAAGYKGSDADAAACVQLLLNSMKHLLKDRLLDERGQDHHLFKFVNQTDNRHETALYLAVKDKHLQVCTLLLENMADWDIKNNRGKSPVMKIFKKLPELVEMLITKRTPDFVQYSDLERSSLSIDFGLIVGHPTEEEIKSKSTTIYEEMSFISNVCYTPLHLREKILNHTMVKIFIWLKWNNIFTYFWMARIFQVLWFTLNFLFLLTVYRVDCPYPSKIQYNFTWFNFVPKERNEIPTYNSVEGCRVSLFGSISSWILLIFSILDCIIFELLPMRVRFHRYWYPMKRISIMKFYGRSRVLWRIIHPFKWIFTITILINVYPVIMSCYFRNQNLVFTELQYVIASIGVALTWHQILLQIGKITWLKVYVKMLLKVLVNICLVLVLYAALILAFAMVFCILLPGVPSFASLYEAILKISTFFIGEVDYEDTFYDENSSAHISPSFGMSIFFYGVAIVILHVALLNFLIGLTITNIQDISKYSDIWGNYSRVWQIFVMETFLAQPFPCFNIFSRVRLKLLKRFMLINYKEYRKLNYKERTLVTEILIDDLPKPFRQEIRALNLQVIGVSGGK